MKKTFKILLFIIVPIFCIILGVVGTIACQRYIKIQQHKQTKNVNSQVPKDPEEIAKEYIIKNGTTTDGYEYTYKAKDGLTLYTTDSKDASVSLIYAMGNYKGYVLESKFYVCKEDTLAVNLKFMKENTDNSTSCDLKIESKTYSKDSRPAAVSYGFEFHDLNRTLYTFEVGNEVYPAISKEEYQKKEKENIKIQNKVKKDFTYFTAQKFMRQFLDMLQEDICPMLDVTMSDFGLENYK